MKLSMSGACDILLSTLESSFLRKLAKNYDECENPIEYDLRKTNLTQIVSLILTHLEDTDLLTCSKNVADNVLSSLLIVYKELLTSGDWNPHSAAQNAQDIRDIFQIRYGIHIDTVLKDDSKWNKQAIFDLCLRKLNNKLTEDLKKYPSLIDVYCLLIQDLKCYGVKIQPLLIFPVPLLLLEDYIKINKLKGLKCCRTILYNMSSFGGTNYYEVLIQSLSKAVKEQDTEITNVALQSLLQILILLPGCVQQSKLDDVFTLVLEEMHTETNLNRKAVLASFIEKIIHMHQVNCIQRKKKFFIIIHENLGLCSLQTTREIFLDGILKCMEIWIQHCWQSWDYNTDKTTISQLTKLLYMLTKQEEQFIGRVQILLITLINLSEDKQKQNVRSQIRKQCQNNKNNQFCEKLQVIHKMLSEEN